LKQIPLCNDLCILFANPIYLMAMLGLTTLQFSAAGLQFWTIAYMQVVLNFNALEAQSIFIGVMLAAMIPGVILGSTSSDYFGGYSGRGLRNALSLCVFYGFCASVFSIWLSTTFEKQRFITLLWLFFFSGAAIMPIANGIIVGCVPKEVQNSGSALYVVMQNAIGLSVAPELAGKIMEHYPDKKEGMIAGYSMLLYGGPLLTLLFLVARLIVRKQMKRMRNSLKSPRADAHGTAHPASQLEA